MIFIGKKIIKTINLSTGNYNKAKLYVSGLAISPDEKNLYVMADAVLNHRSSAILCSINLIKGMNFPLRYMSIDFASDNLAIDPSGKYIYTSLSRKKNPRDLLVKLDVATGKVIKALGIIGNGPYSFVVLRNKNVIYATNLKENFISAVLIH